MTEFQSVIPRRQDGSVIDPSSAINPYSASGKTPLLGTFNAAGQSQSFSPLAGRDFNIELGGVFTATVQLERSLNNGALFVPVTVNGTQMLKLTGPSSESWADDEVGVLYRLNCVSYASGTVNYRISQ